MKLSKAKRRERAIRFINTLKKQYATVSIALDYSSPFELLISTILSAQCTDARVNIVTRDLFKKYHTPEDYINADSSELEKDIFSTGFYKQKTKSIQNCCRELIEKYQGLVPPDFEKLIALPGVGRKTASVVLGNGFGIPAIAVDTHVKRISNIWDLVDTEDPDKIEEKLKELLPPEDWVISSHLIATHGRQVCFARKPKCTECILSDECPGAK
ncbi:MAG: endonuclease III [Ignavibacteriales bacterium]|nr:endonuclease III [Ignavibacteriales bacterium]